LGRESRDLLLRPWVMDVTAETTRSTMNSVDSMYDPRTYYVYILASKSRVLYIGGPASP